MPGCLLLWLSLTACGPAPTSEQPSVDTDRVAVWSSAGNAAAHYSAAPPSTRPVSAGRSSEWSSFYSGPYPGPPTNQITAEPAIRVRVRSAERQLTLGANKVGTLLTARSPRGTQQHRFRAPVTLTYQNNAFTIRDSLGKAVSWKLPALSFHDPHGQPLTLGESQYPGQIIAVASTSQPGKIDAVNYVPLETYLPGVIEKELYANWPIESFRTQAIAARSYALWEKTIANHRHYDLESTEASQVYGGKATNPKAIQAVRETRGKVLAYQGRVVPAFFASSTGGLGASASDAFPNRVPDIAPLRGRVHGAWDAASPTYRWGPIQRRTASLEQRLRAWGQANRQPIANLRGLSRINITDRSPVARPTRFTVFDQRGQAFHLPCEAMRNACNYTADGKLPLDRKARLLSSHFTATVSGGVTTFSDGRGHGHGVGLSQWGAKAMAEAGHAYPAILSFYYPDARIQTLY
jgi:stage II sporulation protein D